MITEYQVIFIPVYNNKQQLKIAIRSYCLMGELFFLVIDPVSCSSEASKANAFHYRKLSNDGRTDYFEHCVIESLPYLTALKKYSQPNYWIQNYGLTQAEKQVDGMFLTVDLCPSAKKFDVDFFNRLVSISESTQRPFPVALCLSGLWMVEHRDAFEWLLGQQLNCRLEITWVNHSFSHIYYKDQPLEENFLLERHTNLNYELLAVEKMLLQAGQSPSVFFRFPGLVANEHAIKKLNEICLLPVGSNAWLAKGERPHPGSIILIHGNGNEPLGLLEAEKLLRQDINWLPLHRALCSM
ncbi:hypothetical protein [Pseudomonas fluorescens]|uniref:hypothetical protein n=1 Tax=Pseudomonas fluorescens TaxID=294 RepID=UPI001BEA5EFC|nr:hypothetical protein [Pseudomonas fluorescens]MBT2375783.1 hypothetical protein [Pseudomonas fluorescens]